MILTTGKVFDKIRLENGHGLVVEFQPDGVNSVGGSSTIEVSFGFIVLPSGQVALSVLMPADCTFRTGSHFVILQDKVGANKIIIRDTELTKVVE